ncbi:DUF1517 domain-containing protein [Synechococcus sp. RSCCF101]|uniref:DUF1517 domain-containing protein n=1 Tax=Synechococcus sp. RSCCF101 TaxID=2511069 RepID=UPI00124908EA|nr:DUF1517 domain-containing protein [Synechococcus sp. RSCCF101]QEY33413.1 DUF1517 domain-containing protein [Synechococcus sp. RSCCF101]
MLATPDPSWAARGGRIGGGSFRAPSMPRSSGGGSFSGGGYRSGGFGGGFGFPFIIPIFGFGGGGLFGFLILMAIAGVLVNAIRGAGGGQGGSRPVLNATPSSASILQVQVGLLASARELQQDLRQLAASSDTSSSSGLQRLLQDTSLALLRHPELWVYARADSGQVPFSSAESTFNRLSMTERSKLDAEVTSNVSGRKLVPTSAGQAGDADGTSDFIVVTLLVACRSRMTLKGSDTAQDLSETLRVLGSISSSDLMALEVIWQPDGAGDVLSADDLVTAYPDLQHL